MQRLSSTDVRRSDRNASNLQIRVRLYRRGVTKKHDRTITLSHAYLSIPRQAAVAAQVPSVGKLFQASLLE